MYNIYIMSNTKLTLSRTQIYLSGQQQAALDVLSKRSATTRSHLIRLAIERLLAAEEQNTAEQHTKRNRLNAIAGSWAKRSASDIDLRKLREGWSRRT
jgi:metal-responsive CopG/Arc/MetJ family transcriptional regulator